MGMPETKESKFVDSIRDYLKEKLGLVPHSFSVDITYVSEEGSEAARLTVKGGAKPLTETITEFSAE